MNPVEEQTGIILALGKKKFDPVTHEYWAANTYKPTKHTES